MGGPLLGGFAQCPLTIEGQEPLYNQSLACQHWCEITTLIRISGHHVSLASAQPWLIVVEKRDGLTRMTG
jgi:hypothetical protein